MALLVMAGIALAVPATSGAALRFSRTDYPVPSLVNHPSQPQGGGLNTVALVDLNKDGKLDIAAADTGTGGVDVWLNQGGGAFAASPANPVNACNNNFGAQDIVAGQLNPQTDQNPDVAVICGSDGNIVRLLGDGHGSLAPQEIVFGTSVGSGLKLAHLSGSSGGDYLFGGPYSHACFIPVTASPGAGAAAAEQCDQFHPDNTPAVLTGVPVHFYDGPCFAGDQVVYFSGIGTFAGWALDPRIGGGAGYNSCASPFQSSGDRASGIPSSSNPTTIAAGDVNGDGEPDVVMADSGGGIHVVGWQGASTTFGGGIPPGEQPTNFASVAPPNALGIADFSGGGCTDIAAAENTSTLVGNDYIEHNFVAIHSGHCNTSQFDAAQSFAVAAGPAGYSQYPSMAVGDLNGDGRPDIVTAGGYGPDAAVTVLLNSTPTSTGGGGKGGATAPVIANETLSPTAFAAAPSGLSALAARHHAKRHYGSKVSYRLNENASVRFSVAQRQPGRLTRASHCVKPTSANRKGRPCTRLLPVRGSFSRFGGAGVNSFRFTGRIGGRALSPGKYQLVATPSAGGTVGQPTPAPFQIIK